VRPLCREGIAKAKAKGVYRGREFALKGEKAARFVTEAKALRRGESLAALAKRYGISRQTAYAYLKRADGDSSVGAFEK
jgi:DNA invertase Pin-like site-specific DNA recombinase